MAEVIPKIKTPPPLPQRDADEEQGERKSKDKEGEGSEAKEEQSPLKATDEAGKEVEQRTKVEDPPEADKEEQPSSEATDEGAETKTDEKQGQKTKPEEQPTLETKIRMKDQQDENQPKAGKNKNSPKADKKRRGLGVGCSCRALGCGSVLLIVALIVGVIALFVVRPDWFKGFLNVDLEAPTYDGTTPESAYSRIALQFTDFGIGENELVITEDQVQAILADQFGESLNVDVEYDDLKIFTNIDGGDVPLWLVMDMDINDDNNPVFENIGFQRIGLPPFLNQIISQVLLSLAGIVSDEDRGFVENLLSLPDNVDVTEVKFLADQVIVTIDVSTGLDNLFQ